MRSLTFNNSQVQESGANSPLRLYKSSSDDVLLLKVKSSPTDSTSNTHTNTTYALPNWPKQRVRRLEKKIARLEKLITSYQQRLATSQIKSFNESSSLLQGLLDGLDKSFHLEAFTYRLPFHVWYLLAYGQPFDLAVIERIQEPSTFARTMVAYYLSVARFRLQSWKRGLAYYKEIANLLDQSVTEGSDQGRIKYQLKNKTLFPKVKLVQSKPDKLDAHVTLTLPYFEQRKGYPYPLQVFRPVTDDNDNSLELFTPSEGQDFAIIAGMDRGLRKLSSLAIKLSNLSEDDPVLTNIHYQEISHAISRSQLPDGRFGKVLLRQLLMPEQSKAKVFASQQDSESLLEELQRPEFQYLPTHWLLYPSYLDDQLPPTPSGAIGPTPRKRDSRTRNRGTTYQSLLNSLLRQGKTVAEATDITKLTIQSQLLLDNNLARTRRFPKTRHQLSNQLLGVRLKNGRAVQTKTKQVSAHLADILLAYRVDLYKYEAQLASFDVPKGLGALSRALALNRYGMLREGLVERLDLYTRPYWATRPRARPVSARKTSGVCPYAPSGEYHPAVRGDNHDNEGRLKAGKLGHRLQCQATVHQHSGSVPTAHQAGLEWDSDDAAAMVITKK